ncbi:hypothetical protein BgiMline_034189 [Biomphalaria glabrata]|uniref:Uncharacterized protein LOC106068780 n=1 Tax=Biomphalaria glabrata TaxID=6526 RepID=A0A2C9KH69_BIOGL|nr:uncharacterized protein LOC106068780 [Biomphalaria glabrata]KAI8744976.1 hypothetical protein BgiMline_020376 [Biomphalaria glabrata]KAI8775947.1 hypothetical protein BgiBS90_023103 [Biomphalaria glabrata]
MDLFIAISLLLWTAVVADEYFEVLGPDRIEEFHVCVGSTAYIPLPLNVVTRSGHESTIITLSFQPRNSEKVNVIASFNGRRKLIIERPMVDRLSISDENLGIYLKKISIDDTGIYTAQARYTSDHQHHSWTRTTNLTVHVRPMIHNNKLNLTQSQVIVPYKRKHCVNITCGTIEYPGYPPAKFVWAAPPRILEVKVATDDSSSSVQICSPFSGDVTCSIAGFASLCTYDHVVKMYLDLPGPPANSSSLEEATMTRDLVLMIVLPILAVAIPITILAIWVLRHLIRNRQQYNRNHPHLANAKPKVEVDIEENRVTEHALDNIEEESETGSQTERKEEIPDTDNEEHSGNENNNDEHDHHARGDHQQEDDEDDSDEDGSEDDESSDDENKAGEEHPLMEVSMSSVV